MEQPRLSLYTIDMKYIRNLAKADDNVMSVSPQIKKQKRPFVGILVLLNNRNYCIPLTSPKLKHENRKNSLDFMKITHPTEKNDKGACRIIGGLNINNMVPVVPKFLKKIDLNVTRTDSDETRKYKELMKNQLTFCQANQSLILKRANKLYDIVTKYPSQNARLTRRCCDFKKLEKVLDKYLESGRN